MAERLDQPEDDEADKLNTSEQMDSLEWHLGIVHRNIKFRTLILFDKGNSEWSVDTVRSADSRPPATK